jgi:murein hydrolase activator
MNIYGKIGFAALILVFFFFSTDLEPRTSFARGSNPETEISKRQRELESIRKEIDDFEKRIQESRKSEQETLSLLDNLDRQTVLVRSYLRDLRSEEQRLVRQINESRRNIQILETEIEELRAQYARYVQSAYKQGAAKDVEVLLSAGSVNQFLIRAEYMKRFSEQRRGDLFTIQEKQRELQLEHEQIETALNSQRRVIREKQQEEKRLTDRIADRRTLINRIRQDRSTFEKELVRRQESEQQLRRVISDLIAVQQQRERRDASRVERGMPAEIVPPAVPFGENKGRLPWPVRGGQIAAKFGEQVHPVLKTVTENTGVDITVQPGSPVYAVAEGDVAYIYWMPAYGNIVLLYHHDGYRTVYANLSDILVRENDRVKAGDVIARSGESISGATVHFEVWKDREKQDPELWLRAQ